jgi:predicted MPP superfamily phosphohydrolase
MKSFFQFVSKKETELQGIKKIVVLGDVGCTGFNEDSKIVFDKILNIPADLFFIVGDLAWTGNKEEFNELINFCNKRAKAPVFALCGNHDIPDYASCCGLSSYALTCGQLVSVFLDNSNGSFLEEDLKFLGQELEKHKEKKFIILFHIPAPLDFEASSMTTQEWQRLRQVIDKHKEKIQCLICGHIHGFYEYNLDGYHIFITGGGGAAMTYKLPKEEFKIYNALCLSLNNDTSVDISVIPI